MIGSRLHGRRNKKTLDVTTRAGTTVTTGVEATWEHTTGEILTPQGGIKEVNITFWFAPASGSLPAILPNHILTDANDGTVYEAALVSNQAGGGNRLQVVCRNLDWVTP